MGVCVWLCVWCVCVCVCGVCGVCACVCVCVCGVCACACACACVCVCVWCVCVCVYACVCERDRNSDCWNAMLQRRVHDRMQQQHGRVLRMKGPPHPSDLRQGGDLGGGESRGGRWRLDAMMCVSLATAKLHPYISLPVCVCVSLCVCVCVCVYVCLCK